MRSSTWILRESVSKNISPPPISRLEVSRDRETNTVSLDVKRFDRGIIPPMAKSVERDHIDEFLESIRDELPDLDLGVEGIVDRIMGLSRRIKRMMEETCAEHGLTWGEWKLLGYLLRQAGPTRRASPGQLAERLELSSGAMTNRLDRLEEAGLIERLRDPDDRRGVQVELTAAGREAYQQTTTAQAEKEALVASALSAREKKDAERAPSPHDDHVRGLRAGSNTDGRDSGARPESDVQDVDGDVPRRASRGRGGARCLVRGRRRASSSACSARTGPARRRRSRC